MIYLKKEKHNIAEGENPWHVVSVETEEEANLLKNPAPFEDGTEQEKYIDASEDEFLTRDMSQEERDAFLAAKAAEDKAANDAAEAEAVEDAAEINEALEGETGTASVDVVMTHNPDAEADLV